MAASFDCAARTDALLRSGCSRCWDSCKILVTRRLRRPRSSSAKCPPKLRGFARQQTDAESIAASMPQEMEADLLARLQIGDTTDPLAAETVPIAENMEPVIPLNGTWTHRNGTATGAGRASWTLWP